MNLPPCSILVLLGRTAWGCPRSRGLPWSSWPRDNSAPAVWSPSPPTWPARVTLRCAAPWNQVTDGNSAGFLACRFTCDIWASLCFFFFGGCVSHEQCSKPPLFRDYTIKYIVTMITIHQGNPYQPTDIKGRRRDFEHCWHVRAFVQTYITIHTPDATYPTYLCWYLRSFLPLFVRMYVHLYTHTHIHTHTYYTYLGVGICPNRCKHQNLCTLDSI